MGHFEALGIELGVKNGSLVAAATGPLGNALRPLLEKTIRGLNDRRPVGSYQGSRVLSLLEPPFPGPVAERSLAVQAYREIFHRPVPGRLVIAPSPLCPCRCPAADAVKGFAGAMLSTEDLCAAIQAGVDLGITTVKLAGGEPLLHEEIHRLIEAVDPQRAVTVLCTNGLLLDRRRVKELSQAGLYSVLVSIDLADAARHDALRGMPGLFEAAMAGIARAQEEGLLVGIATTVTPEALAGDELERLVELAAQRQVGELVVYHSLVGASPGDPRSAPLAKGELEKLETMARVSLARPSGPVVTVRPWGPARERAVNGLGPKELAVMPGGQVRLWLGSPSTLGTLSDGGLGAVWDRLVDPTAEPLARRLKAAAIPDTRSVAHRIGLLAGSGHYPIYFAREARKLGHEVVILAIEGEADKKIAQAAGEVQWVGLGRLETVLSILREQHVSQLVLTGKIHKTQLFSPLELDELTRRVIASVHQKDDVSILLALIQEFEKSGIAVCDPTRVVPNLQVAPGVLTRTEPTVQALSDIRYGFAVAKELARHGIGQTVVVKDGVIVAVEAIEGTDKTIQRARTLVAADLVVVKVGGPSQDRRFDMPVIGVETLKTLVRSHVRTLGIDAANTILVDRESVLAEADRLGLALVAL